MWRTKKIGLFSLLLVTLHWQCVQTYVSPYKSPPTGYLVVEGYISGNSPTRYTLSRTIPLPGDTTNPMETGATVQVEGNDNTAYPLTEQSAGIYEDSLALNPTTQYRLRITTTAGEVYLSGYVPYKPTPPIDSVNWVYNSNGVQIYVNTHDPANATRYYQWEYGETWQYNSAEQSTVEYDPDTTPVVMVIPRPAANQIYTCWHSDSSTKIIINNSVKLAQDIIYRQPLVSIPFGAQQIGVLYSIFVRQYALTEAGYNFLSLMQQNTESLGSIFDATPSQLVGNIQCLTNPNEPVVGYVSAGTVQQQRVFIYNYQLPRWYYVFACEMLDKEVPLDVGSLIQYFGQEDYIPIEGFYPTGTLVAWTSNLAGCIDCRLQGGTTQEPSFWPN